RAAAALFGRDRHLAGDLGEGDGSLGVDDRLLVLDAGPLGVAGHYSSAPNIVSMILPEANPNKIPFSGADDILVGERHVLGDLVSVDPDAALLEQPPGFAGA